MPRLYSYVVQHDHGFAPNPFHGLCTLACCKPQIRRTAKVGDFVMGTGSAEIGLAGHLVYWMRVAEVVSFDDYWVDTRFRCKRPVMNGSMMQRYGDNIYRTGPDGEYEQLDSFHSEDDGSLSVPNRHRDTGSTSNVLIGGEFAFYGKEAPLVPEALGDAISSGRPYKCRFKDAFAADVQAWLRELPDRGRVGEPGRW